jgi:two-component system sensor histidine kinase KdpD
VLLRGRIGLDSVLLIYLLVVVVISVVGGLVPGLLGAVASFLLANWFLTPPYYTFEVQGRDRLIELFVFVVIAGLVSITVHVGARNQASAERNLMEARLLSRLTSAGVGTSSPERILGQIRELFDLAGVELLDPAQPPQGRALVVVGERDDGKPCLTLRSNSDLVVNGYGQQRFAEDSRLLKALADTAARSWEEQRLAREAARAEQLAATDRVRAALLAAVGHDLRTPLAGIKASVSTLRQDDVELTAEDRGELLASIEDSADRLADLISNLLDLSRIQAGAVSVHLSPVSVDEVVGRSLLNIHAGRVDLEVPENMPMVLADAGLLERVLANLLNNALRFSPADRRPKLRASTHDNQHVVIEVVDHGPGVPHDQWGEMFMPFQRLGDRDNRSGVGIGLAIARGFSQAMSVELEPLDTPGGGLTMRIVVPAAP